YYLRQTFPPGWSSSPNPYGWACGANAYGQGRSPFIFYYFNDPNYGTGDGNSFLYTPTTYDFSTHVGVQIDYYHYWNANYPSGSSDGYIQASTDGGATWITLREYHWNNPSSDQGNRMLESTAVGGAPSVRFRFYYVSNDDWWWAMDNVRVTGVNGYVMEGLGSAEGTVVIANVAPGGGGGFDTAMRTESASLLFDGFEIVDPALTEPTEWFAYAWDFDDTTPVAWRYVGTLAPPKLDILVLQTLCPVGDGCSIFQALKSALLAQDDVGTVTSFNFYQGATYPTPTLDYMLTGNGGDPFDVIMLGINYFVFNDPVRRAIGNNLANYLDTVGANGGVLTFVGTHSTYFGLPVDILGRYIEDDYGAFESAALGGPATGLHLMEPDHDFFFNTGTSVNSLYVADGEHDLTEGGGGNAAGRNGQLLAHWASSMYTAIGVKELANGARTGHIGAFMQPAGSDYPMLLRNAIGWVSGGLPTPKIPAFDHPYGDNGIYTVDFIAIDDDMGFVWDDAAGAPVAVPGFQTAMSHRYIEVAIDNVDPTLAPGTIEAFVATEFCVRIRGTVGNTVTASIYIDGVLSVTVTATRQVEPDDDDDDDDGVGGSPTDDDDDDDMRPTVKCGIGKVDVTAPHTYDATLVYSAPNGGGNPTRLTIESWRGGDGARSFSYNFVSGGPTQVAQPLPTLKRDLLRAGAVVDFVAEAVDPGTDDIVFFWDWGPRASGSDDWDDDGTGSQPWRRSNALTAAQTINVHHNDGSLPTAGVMDSAHFLGFSEPYFDRPTNDERSAMGTTFFRVRDTAVHSFGSWDDDDDDDDGVGGSPTDGGSQPVLVFYVLLIVLDDDNNRGYASDFHHDGIDIEYIFLDFR
ncbi:MAG TPA: hypothetical protein VJ400_03920, partial [Thermoplasmata archaeon]|nr:hypothetical protein [Thermoplasmata archaeon]